ncbi:MAG: threonine synthase [Hyphomicrobiaceae bacterium]|nr:threonine synthase [Hyphomicrobiaceae bacterium]
MSFVSHLECSQTGAQYPHDRFRSVSDANAPLLVRYDLEAMKAAISKETLATRAPDMWRYLEWLPIEGPDRIVSLGEPMTPLLPLNRLADGQVIVKDEGRMPTGSFKARGLAIAVSMAKAFGIDHVAIPTAGNAGAALGAYCSRAGIRSTVFCPDDAPETTIREIAFHGADTYRVNGLINHCGEIVASGTEQVGWLDLSTLKEPYRIEGKKTMGLELAEQLGWDLPDVIFYPTGGGTGLIGMWKAFEELAAMGWVGSKRPRMIAVQSTRCGPLVKAFDEGHDEVKEPWTNAETVIHGVRVPKPFGDRLCLKVMRESNGLGSMVDDYEVIEARAAIARKEGIHLSIEGAACFVAWRQEVKSGRINSGDRAILFNCASGLKADLPPVETRIDHTRPIDYSRFR